MKHLIILALLFHFGCRSNDDPQVQNAELFINENDLALHVSILASDDFQGRQPSTIGEEKTINYLKKEFEKLGLEPGNGNSFFQEVPLVEITTDPGKTIFISGSNKTTELKYAKDFVATNAHVTNAVTIENAELIFTGYGIVAPEYNWNDYEGIDVKDKIVVVLVNDPGFTTKNPELFNGYTMTYYGRWTYKYEEAARQGAAGCLIIHETEAASYPWTVVENGWTGPQFYLSSDNNNNMHCKLEGWITTAKAIEIFEQAGFNFEESIQKAVLPEFKPFSLGLTTSVRMKNKIQHSVSNNVIALLPGSVRPDEYIIYTAHWDHFGVDKTITDDHNIYSGARDNATGTAALIEIAKAFVNLETKPERSIVFLAVTAEEQGLLGSKYYSLNPIFPLEKTVAVLNMDALNIFGRTKDVVIIGYGNSELDDYVYDAVKVQERIVMQDPTPHAGSFYRSDHFSFAKQGVPALYIKSGYKHLEKGEEWMRKVSKEWTSEFYHTTRDVYDPDWWDLSGAIEDIRLLFRIGYRLSNENKFPNWREGNEFRAARDEQMTIIGQKQ